MNQQSTPMTIEQANQRLLTLYMQRDAMNTQFEQIEADIKALRNYAGGYASAQQAAAAAQTEDPTDK